MKKWLALALALILCLCLTACGDNQTTTFDDDYQYEGEPPETSTGTTALTAETAELNALRALLDFLYGVYGYNDEDYDISRTTYQIGSIKGNGDGGYIVKGRYYLYDCYGDRHSGFNSFEIEVRKTGGTSIIDY